MKLPQDIEQLLQQYGSMYLVDFFEELMEVWVCYNSEEEKKGCGVCRELREYYVVLRSFRDIFKQIES